MAAGIVVWFALTESAVTCIIFFLVTVNKIATKFEKNEKVCASFTVTFNRLHASPTRPSTHSSWETSRESQSSPYAWKRETSNAWIRVFIVKYAYVFNINCIMTWDKSIVILYRRLLRLHRTLPKEIRELGVGYIREEFKKQRKADRDFLKAFEREWTVSVCL